MFFGKKERELVKQVNDELAERIIGQPIAYYPISIEESNFNDIYGEAIDKVSLPPVRVYAYVEVANEQTNERYGYDYQTSLTINFSEKRLTADQNLYVRVGDFVQYGDQFYEIVKTYNDTRYYFGQVEHKFQISADCVRARQGTFRVLEAIDRQPDRGVTAGETTSPAPRVAPIPPLKATYVTVTPSSRLPNERVLTAGAGITLTDGGANSTITIASSGQNALGPTGSLQFTPGAGSFSGSHSLRFDPALKLLELTGAMNLLGDLTASARIRTTELTASTFRLAPRSGSLAGSGSYLGLDSNNNVVIGFASATGGAGTPGGATTQVQFNDAGAFGGSANLTFNGTTLTGSYTGSLAQVTTLSASVMNLLPTSGTLAGGGSYLGLDSNNNVILSAGDGATTSPAAPVNSIQFNNASSFGGTANLTFDGSTFDVKAKSHLSGGVSFKRTAVTTNYSITTSDYYLGVDTTSSPLTLTIPSASAATEGQTFVVKDEGGATATNAITLSCSAAETIDGITTTTITSPYGAVSMYTNGSSWFLY